MKKRIILFLWLIAICVYAAGEYLILQDNVGVSVTTDGAGDSTYMAGIVSVGSTGGFRTLHAEIVLGNAQPAYAGLGNSDSGWIWLYTSLESGDRINADSTVKASLPCTLNTVIHSNVGDTLLRDYIEIGWAVYDSLGDSSFTATYPIKYKIKLK